MRSCLLGLYSIDIFSGTGGLLLCLLSLGDLLPCLLRTGWLFLCLFFRGGLLFWSGGRLFRPGGLLARLLSPGGLKVPSVRPGGLLSRLLCPGGLLSRLLRPGGLLSRLFSPGGLQSCLLRLGTPLCLCSWSRHLHMVLALRPSPGSTSAPPPSWIVLSLECLEAAPWGGALLRIQSLVFRTIATRGHPSIELTLALHYCCTSPTDYNSHHLLH